MSIFQQLKQPFPIERTTKGKLGMAAFFGLFVFGFLVLFKPFGLDVYSFSRVILVAFIYGLITFTCIFLSAMVLPTLFPAVFNEARWTTGKHIILVTSIIFLVGLVNYLLSPLLVDSSLSLYTAIWFQGITLAIGIIPISLISVVRQNQLLKHFSQQAEQLEKKLQQKNESLDTTEPGQKAPVSNKIILSGDYQNEKVEVYIDDLHLVTTASNYIKLYHLQQDKLVYSIIRSTLKKAEPAILGYPVFFKCHRAFIINLDKVIHVEGNAQGYKVRIKDHDELVPVSRNLNSEFSDRLLAFRKQSREQTV